MSIKEKFETEDNLKYNFFAAGKNDFVFKLRAAHDAHIALTSTKDESDPMLEVFIGGLSNSKSMIRKNRVSKPYASEAKTPAILDAGEFRGFWISWINNEILVGREGEAASVLKYKNTEAFPINFVGISTAYGATGSWKLEIPVVVPETEEPVVDVKPKIEVVVPEVEPKIEDLGSKSPDKVVVPETENPVPKPVVKVVVPEIKPKVEVQTPVQVPETRHPVWVATSGNKIPKGAIIGGEDGEPLYIGRAKHKGTLTPGKVVPSLGVCYIGLNLVEHAKEEYEILVGGQISWVATSGNNIPASAMPAGKTERDETLYVGRAKYGPTVTIGKVQPSHKACYIPYKGLEIRCEDYEILTEIEVKEVEPDVKPIIEDPETKTKDEIVFPDVETPVQVPKSRHPVWVATSGKKIPKGAIVGGEDGEPLYIGRAKHKGTLTPGKVVPSLGVCYIGLNLVEHAKEEYEILVGGQISWVATSGNNIPASAMPAGKTECDETLYVGRVNYKGTITIGKVHPSHKVCFFTTDGREMRCKDYEILTV